MAHQRRAQLLAGTVTFLAAKLDGVDPANGVDGPGARCPEPVRAVIAAHQGVLVTDANGGGGSDDGDQTLAVFASAIQATTAALDLQRQQVDPGRCDGPRPCPRLRIGMHTGESRTQGDHLGKGAAVQLATRLCDAAHPGRTLLSMVTATLAADALPGGAWLVDQGAHRLRDLARPERVFELRHADLAGDFPPLGTLDALATNLPVQLTTFVGRSEELATVEDLLGRERLVTLTGSGGCGKTRLAARAATEVADRWPDGVWWADLGPLTDAARVAELVASTVRVMVEPGAGPLRALTVHLRDRRLLVCLDNCEHLLEPAVELTDALLRSCPQVAVLATSREPLGVAGETVWRVPSMVEHDAVTLFCERASQVRPGFSPAGDEQVVRTICRRLDGIPLAIELAAAWIGTLSPAQIAEGLDDRFRLLSGGPHGVTARQQTLAASVAWSYELLDPLERAVFRRLAVFAGGFTIDAARTVCAGDVVGRGDVLATVRRLVDKSLVVVDHGDREARYRLLETIRHYAQDRLDGADETTATRDRHLDHFLALAETAEPELEDADQDSWLARLEGDHDNLRAALEWGLSAADADAGRRLAAALPRFWLLHGHTADGIRYVERARVAAPDDRSILQNRLLVGASLLGATGGRFDLTIDSARRGLEVAIANEDDRHRARCLAMLAYIDVYLDFAGARSLCQEARRHAEAADDAFATDLSLVLEGLALTNSDRHDAAAPLLARAADRCHRRGDRNLAAFALTGQMEAAYRTGDVRGALRLGTEALRLAEPLNDYFTVGATTSNLAWVTGLAGDLDTAHRLMRTVVRSLEGATDAIDAPTMAVTLGRLHLWAGDLVRAVHWFERAARFAEPFVDNLIVARALPGLAATHRHLGHLDQARDIADRALQLARRLDSPHGLAVALDETAILVSTDDPARAERLHHDALAVRVQHQLRTYYPDSLDLLGHHAAQAGNHTEAVRLHAASDAARTRIGYPRPPVDLAGHESAVADLRTALGPDLFDAAWAEGATLSLDDVIAYLSRSRGPRGRPSRGWASLTPTELTVVGLAAQGLTNPEIGARLLMSPNTVKAHLAHVYAKLDVANRTELATLASSHLG